MVGEPLTQRSRSRALRRRDAVIGYALLAPSLFGVACFLVLPVLVVVWLSFQSWDLIHPLRFAGLANYASVLTDPVFGNALLVTAVFVVIVIPVQTALGLFGASLLTRGLPGSAVLRTIYALPWICAPLALGVVWKWIFAPTGGALNALLGVRVEWLTDPVLALPAAAAVVIWTNVGYVTLFFLAGLLNIPNHIVEAARIDGAGPVALFWRIKLPLLRPTMFFVLVTSVIATFQLFDQIYALTGGGPEHRTDVVANRIYTEAFQSFDLGRASVMAVVLLVLLVAITVGQQLYFRRRTTYDLG
ncbi:carbohydrate ABC transporter membrane protein 1, CUT1 family [Leifsonia sp. 98AMF]|nr:carbohydrate ABC transporter membrane protein 1, CUT1 family [Leifsonia sp. 197AMF]SDJ43246.1 carbohydrate ABC transporter membrane protein 1, CUT1 family [Leifsonia sp. 466MF]SDK33425.1 carbohydrate ABC transporter membrane protein 1, CUT1 family [Leifsonia sp. 157MF]SDN63664.1 carbohydrate ABC transporter membrane protein 1, CUT1 family [Leifsonia sp. 509MF]SEN45255.1 carbohydrate ABC transporter membrane protein 1, CUT1 family [Leifsonia sp. 467MF]SFM88261.1 carbohydrate ABC transporter 